MNTNNIINRLFAFVGIDKEISLITVLVYIALC